MTHDVLDELKLTADTAAVERVASGLGLAASRFTQRTEEDRGKWTCHRSQ